VGVRRTGKPNGRPANSLEGKTVSDLSMKNVPIDVFQKLNDLRTGSETQKDILIRIVREYEAKGKSE
jgi:hypothetical protein